MLVLDLARTLRDGFARAGRSVAAGARRLLSAEVRGVGSLGFGARLAGTFLFTLGLIAAAAFLVLEHDLAGRQIDEYAAAQRADVRAFELQGQRAVDRTDALLDIDRLIDGVAQREGTLEALLIDQQHVIVATSKDALLGTRDVDSRIRAALTQGRSYAGHEADPRRDRRNFEFVAPVRLFGGRYAYEISYDHRTYDKQLAETRLLLGLVAGIGALLAILIFYLAGGRRLLAEHQMVLRRATRDGLTDLSNQRAFDDEFAQAVAAAIRYQDPLALALLDVDDFKQINDRHGHPHGDAVLRQVAQALRAGRPGDRPYRIGGDEFALILPHADEEGAATLARRLCRDLADTQIAVSIGISALRPGTSAQTLRSEADAALYEAKRRGGKQTAEFGQIRERVTVTSAEKKQAVRDLIDTGQLTSVYQPIWNLKTQTLLGVEALMRPDPSYELDGPAEVFEIAEQLGRVHPLDVLCVNSALQTLPDLDPGVLLFLNLAPVTLDLDADGNDWLTDAIHHAGLDPSQVVIEITEHFGGRTASIVKCLTRLREQGFQIAIDDAGSGNSGLELLRAVHADYVKIDRSITTAAATEPNARAVLIAIATFAHQTGAYVIAEGIEDPDTLTFLENLDTTPQSRETIIQGGQGFQLGRPTAAPTLRPTPLTPSIS